MYFILDPVFWIMQDYGLAPIFVKGDKHNTLLDNIIVVKLPYSFLKHDLTGV